MYYTHKKWMGSPTKSVDAEKIQFTNHGPQLGDQAKR